MPDFSSGDIELAYTINGEKTTKAFPKKSQYIKANTLACENGVTAEWDNNNWGIININAGDNTKIKCNIDFKVEIPTPMKATEYVKILSEVYDYELAYDETNDDNIRYIGKNPNNYVSFNGELWRIIGVMNNVVNENDIVASQIKLIRNESLGSFYHRSLVDTVEWDKSGLMMMLNPENRIPNDFIVDSAKYVLDSTGKQLYKSPASYWNRTSGFNPASNIDGGLNRPVDFSQNGLMNEAKSMIAKVKWNLGGAKYSTYTASDFYASERGEIVADGTSTSWIGEVGLMYPSDYWYATAGDTTMKRSECLKSVSNWRRTSSSKYLACLENNWLGSLNNNNDISTLTPDSSNNTVNNVNTKNNLFFIDYNTGVRTKALDVNAGLYVKPALYLNKDIKITSGTGSSTDPYILQQ